MIDFQDPSIMKTLGELHGSPVVSHSSPEEPVDNPNVSDEGNIHTSTHLRKYTDPAVLTDKKGNILEIYIHQSLIKKIMNRGTRRDYCPLQIYYTMITGELRSKPSKYMLNGLYFEAGALNGGVDKDGKIPQLNRLKNGKKSTENLRIDEQIFNFRESISKQLNLIIRKDNIWRKFNAEVDDSVLKDRFSFKIFVELETDLISPINYKEFNDDVAIIDVKLTGDRNGCFGEFCWGHPEEMDHIQAFLYSFTLGLPFYYIVVDYPANGRGWKLVPVNTNVNHLDPRMAEEAKRRKKEMFQTIRATAAEIESNHIHGWKTNPMPDNCKGCPVSDCKDRKSISVI